MRTLHADLTAAQKAYNIKALYKVQLTQGANDYTYTQARIRRIPNHLEASSNQVADIVLDNSDGTLTTIDFTGYKGVISYGMTDANGTDRYSACAPLWVIGSQLVSWPGGLALRLSLAGIPNRLKEDKASNSFRLQSDDLQTIKDLLTQIGKAVLPARANATTYALDDLVIAATTNGYVYKCTTAGTSAASPPTWAATIGNTVADSSVVWTNQGRELTVYSHCAAYTVTFDSEDSLIDSFAPKESFSIVLNESRMTAMETLLNWTKNSFRAEDDGEIHIFQPTVSGTVYNYEYSLASGEHTFFNKSYRNRLVIPNYISVVSLDAGDGYTGIAEDTDSSALLPIREHYKLKVTGTAQATSIAGAILEKHQLDAEKGSALVPMNVGQEVYDYVKVTDARENDNRVGNILSIRRTVNPPQWTMEIQFGSGIGGMGTSATLLNMALPEATQTGLTEKQRERQQIELWTIGLLSGIFSDWSAWAAWIEYALKGHDELLIEIVRLLTTETIISEKTVYLKAIAETDNLTVADGKVYFTVPEALNGMNLIDADASVYTVSTSGLPTIQIYNVTDAVDMLSTRITIDANEKTSFTADAPAVIDTTKDDVVKGDQLRIDVDVAGTGTKGLDVILVFERP